MYIFPYSRNISLWSKYQTSSRSLLHSEKELSRTHRILQAWKFGNREHNHSAKDLKNWKILKRVRAKRDPSPTLGPKNKYFPKLDNCSKLLPRLQKAGFRPRNIFLLWRQSRREPVLGRRLIIETSLKEQHNKDLDFISYSIEKTIGERSIL